MSRYVQSSLYYDAVNSQSNHPGYTSQPPTTSASTYSHPTTTSYQPSNHQSYSSTFASQQYGSGTGNSTDRSVAVPGSMSSQSHFPASMTDGNHRNTYENASWNNAGYNSEPLNASNAQIPNYSYNSRLSLHPTQTSSGNAGNMAVSEHLHDGNTSSYPVHGYQNARIDAASVGSTWSHQTAYTQQMPGQQQQRYSSPLHAVQAKQQQFGHNRQSSQLHKDQSSPQTSAQTNQRLKKQSSALVEPSPTTVNPSQVYDNRAEMQRKAQLEEERKRKRKREEEDVARKADEERMLAEKRREEEATKEYQREAGMKKTEIERKAAERKKAREEKRQSKSAATALQRMASSGVPSNALAAASPPENDEEAEMRAMFKKMREFNARNPAMLAKLWEEERYSHSQSQTSQQADAASTPNSLAEPPKSPVQQDNSHRPTVASQLTSNTASVRPLQKLAAPVVADMQNVVSQTTNESPSSATATTSLWPPQKKDALANAAAKWLSALPENVSKSVGKEDLLKILDTSPSYVQLCEALEALGLSFDRSTLARELLKAVPDGLKAHQEPKATTPLLARNGTGSQVNAGLPNSEKKNLGPPSKAQDVEHAIPLMDQQHLMSRDAVPYGIPAFHSLNEAARDADGMDTSSPLQNDLYGTPAQRTDYQQRIANGTRAHSLSQQPEMAPNVKVEEMHRPPANKEEAARKRTFNELVDLTKEASDDEELPKDFVFQPQPLPVHGTRPPVQRSLQQQDKIKKLKYHSQDQLTLPPPKSKGFPAELMQQERLKGKMLVEPIMRDRVARKSKYDSRTIARDVLLATGRHPDMRALNAHLNSMQKLLGDHGGSYDSEGNRGNRSDLSTIRWDVIDPGEPDTAAGKLLKRNVEEPHTTDNADDEVDEEVAPRVIQHTLDNGGGTVAYVAVQQPLMAKPKKRRGRRPRYSALGANSLTVDDGRRRRPSSTIAQNTSAQPAASNAASASGSGATPTGRAPVGYAAFRQVDENGNVIKKKGRPVGWRKDIHSRAAQGLPPMSNASLPARLRQAQPPKHDKLQEPRYQVYKCMWLGCKAELHNLDTLKKHVVKIHGRPGNDGMFECFWKGCEGRSDPAESGKGKARREVASFDDIEGWMEHVDEKHFQPIAWKLGDGPRGGMSDQHDSASEAAYLSDAQGRSVTPVIQPPQPRNPGSAEATTQAQPGETRPPDHTLGEVMTKDERKAAGELKQLEDHKRAVGPTMEKEGSTLAIQKRRQGFLDDEDFEDEICEDDVESSEH